MMILSVQDASDAADYDVSQKGDKLGYRSQSGRVLCLASSSFRGELEGVLYPLEWHSTVIRRVCKSTLQAESLSLLLGATEAEHARGVIHGLYEDMDKLDNTTFTIRAQDRTRVVWVTDCMSLWSHLLSPQAGSVSDKRLAIDLSALRQELWRDYGEYTGDPLSQDFPPSSASTEVIWATTDRMLADALTKRITFHKPLTN